MADNVCDCDYKDVLAQLRTMAELANEAILENIRLAGENARMVSACVEYAQDLDDLWIRFNKVNGELALVEQEYQQLLEGKS